MTAMVEKVARAICVSQGDDWGRFYDQYPKDARAALEACHFEELVRALKQAEAKLSDIIAAHDAPMESRIVRMARAVLAKVGATHA